MDDSVPMGVRDGLTDVEEDVQEPRQFLGHARTDPEHLLERPAADQSHHEERLLVGREADLVNRHDPRMLQSTRDPSLFHESANHLLFAAMLVQQHLDRDLTLELVVPRFVDRADAAATDLTADEIPPGATSIGWSGASGTGKVARDSEIDCEIVLGSGVQRTTVADGEFERIRDATPPFLRRVG